VAFLLSGLLLISYRYLCESWLDDAGRKLRRNRLWLAFLPAVVSSLYCKYRFRENLAGTLEAYTFKGWRIFANVLFHRTSSICAPESGLRVRSVVLKYSFEADQLSRRKTQT